MCRSPRFFFAAFFSSLALLLAPLSATSEEKQTGSLASESVEQSRSSEYELPISGSSTLAESEPLNPTDALENLLNEWDEFTKEWNAFYPALEALGIELGELPSYLESLKASLESERRDRELERQAATEQEALLSLRVQDLEKDIKKHKTIAVVAASACGAVIAVEAVRLLLSLHPP